MYVNVYHASWLYTVMLNFLSTSTLGSSWSWLYGTNVVGFTAIYNIGIKLLDSVCINGKSNVLLFYSLILVKDCGWVIVV